MPGPLDDNDYVDNIVRGGRGGRGPTGGPGGTGPAGLAGSLGYGAGGYGSGGAYSAAGGYSRRRRRPLGGYTGTPVTPEQSSEDAIQQLRASMGGPLRSSQPLGGPTMAPTGEGMASPTPTRQPMPTKRYGGMGGRIQGMVERGVREGRFPNAPGAPAERAGDGLDVTDEFNRAMQEWIRGGGLSPGGSESEMEAIRGEVRRANSAGRERARNRARLSAGGDPQATAFADIMSEVQGNRALSDSMASARAGLGDRQARMLAALFGGGLDNTRSWQARDQQAALQRRGVDHQQGGWLDDLAGMAGGSLLGGVNWGDLLMDIGGGF